MDFKLLALLEFFLTEASTLVNLFLLSLTHNAHPIKRTCPKISLAIWVGVFSPLMSFLYAAGACVYMVKRATND